MAISTLALVLFAVLTLVGILISYFAYDVYRKTSGGSKGWIYMLITAAMVGVYAFTAAISGVMGIPSFQNYPKLVLDGISFLGLSLFFPLAMIRLFRDMGGKGMGFLTTRNYLIYYVFIIALLFALNAVFSEPSVIPVRMASVGIISLMFFFPVVALGAYMISKQTGMVSWRLLVLGSLLIVLASFLEVPLTSGCGGLLYNDVRLGLITPDSIGAPEICAENMGTMFFGTVVPAGSALNFLLPVAIYSDAAFLIGALIVVYAFFLIWKSFR